MRRVRSLWSKSKPPSCSGFAVALLLSALVALANSCGGTAKRAAHQTAGHSALALLREYTQVDADRDNDVAAPYDDKNNDSQLDYGRPAAPAQQRAAGALLRRYYATALSGDGAAACKMIISTLAESVAEDYGHGSAGPPYLRSGTTCPGVMDLLFAHFHALLALEVPKLEVARVRVIGKHGLAILRFGNLPERTIPLGQEGTRWKVRALLDTELS
jgi:hypothetical protein